MFSGLLPHVQNSYKFCGQIAYVLDSQGVSRDLPHLFFSTISINLQFCKHFFLLCWVLGCAFVMKVGKEIYALWENIAIGFCT